MTDLPLSAWPVVVVGAGPVGLAAAAELLDRGVEPVVLERGHQAGAAVAQWNHVRLFSQWSELIAPAARRLLDAHGWLQPAANGYPTGREWVDEYLRPLADALGERVRFDAEVVGVARRGRDRVVDAGRDQEPFTVHVRTRDGAEERITARAVIDASGTWESPNPLGGDVCRRWESERPRNGSATGSRTWRTTRRRSGTRAGTWRSSAAAIRR